MFLLFLYQDRFRPSICQAGQIAFDLRCHIRILLLPQAFRRRTRSVREHFLRRAGKDHRTALLSAARSKVQDMIGSPDELLVVLHYDDCVSSIHQPVQQEEKMLHILRM